VSEQAATNSAVHGTAAVSYEVVLVTYRSAPLVKELFATLPPDLPVVVVDNAHGVDGLAEIAAARPATRYIDGPGRGFASGANVGARTSTSDVVIFLNPDASPTIEQLDALAADVAADERLGAIAATLVLPSGQVEIGAGGWEPTFARALVHAVGAHKLFPNSGLWARPVPGRPIELDWINGGCMAVRRETFLRLGGFDERFFVYNEDVAFGRTLREAGLRQRLRTDMLVKHLVGGSGEASSTMLQLRGASLVRYVRRYNRPSAVLGIKLALTLGYGPRYLLCRARGKDGEAREHVSYLKGLWLGAPDMGS
jgi:N-acetylglucosaminyl-diphospho-decaprenol L-rhamnosyltransferase